MSYLHSLVTLCPASVRQDLLDLGTAYGVDAGMVVELSPTGSAPATHYGSHAWASAGFVAIVTGQVQHVPDGYTQEQVDAILGQCLFSVDKDGLTNRAHFDAVLTDQGLQHIQVELP